jgi:type 1 glutamine amidotransferase
MVLFYTTGSMDELVKKGFTKAGLEALVEWVKGGHAFAGVHSSTDTLAEWQPYWEMIGGSFDGHPWGSDDPAIQVDVEDPSHPAALPIPYGWKIQDEIYQMKNYSRDRVHVILSMNAASVQGKGARQDNDYAIAWCREFGKGKVFYTSLGHREDVWTNPTYQAHLLGGLLWALGTPGYESDADSGPPEALERFRAAV